MAENAVLTATLEGASDVAAFVEPAAGGAAIRDVRPDLQDGFMRVAWNGKDNAGKDAPLGEYRFRIEAHDAYGSLSEVTSRPFRITDKLIVISMTQQAMVAYQGKKQILNSLITTGGPELPTPIGIFHIMDNTSPLTMYSPWPKGDPRWYPDSVVHYALEFYENDAYGLYIHDASWRSYFGPGSNDTPGTPGEDGTGTHGCINVPLEEQAVLYQWAEIGTPVVVQL